MVFRLNTSFLTRYYLPVLTAVSTYFNTTLPNLVMTYASKVVSILAARLSLLTLLHSVSKGNEELLTAISKLDEDALKWREELCNACSAGDLDAVKRIMEEESSERIWKLDWMERLYISKEEEEHNWMYISARKGNADLLTLLLTKHINRQLLHLHTSDGRTPLLVACESNAPIECIQILIANGSRVNVSGPRAFTPLSWAVYHNNAKVTSLLLQTGMNIKDPKYINIAEANRSYEIFPILATHGCRLQRPETLYVIHHIELTTIIRSLITPPKSRNSAVKFREPLRIISPLLSCLDEEVLMRKTENQTILHTTSSLADDYALATLKLILHRFPNVDLETTDNEGRTSLGVACENKNYETVDLLISKGAKIDALMSGWCGGKVERSPLHFAVCRRDLKLASLLLRRGCEVDLCDGEGKTALHLALEGIGGYEDANHAEITDLCRLLIHQFDCSLEVRTRGTGRTPLHLACKLKSATEESWGVKFLELLDGNPRGSKVNVNAQDGKGKTALHIAAKVVGGRWGRRLCEWLLEHGAMYSILDGKGRTAGECAKADEVKKLFKGLERDSNVPSLMSLCAGVVWRERIIVSDAPDRVLEVLYPAVYQSTMSAPKSSTPLKLVQSLEDPPRLGSGEWNRQSRKTHKTVKTSTNPTKGGTPKGKRVRASPLANRMKKVKEEEGVGSESGNGGKGGEEGVKPLVFGEPVVFGKEDFAFTYGS
ncbi:Transient receptor putative cation channel sub A member 1 [Rhizophlyctis rosea]|uniref:Transient receptor putative cation channel sub A member 1 n=1 Tax=Rhizophlyctis rosea TaxID=64517 RepID=A0AAD5SCN6_9FUNG|nr:Transient receptor putative cation channel sub A member 1 [Rhizophlyctis rosea]